MRATIGADSSPVMARLIAAVRVGNGSCIVLRRASGISRARTRSTTIEASTALTPTKPRLVPIGGDQPLVAASIQGTCSTCVIIPARDEAQSLPAALRALARQHKRDGRPFDYSRYEVIVLANNCTDETAAVARMFAAAHPKLALHVVERTLPPGAANVGTARLLLMDEACRRLLDNQRPGGIIASTDADTVVEAGWLAALEAEIALGAEAVGGRIITDPLSGAEVDLVHRGVHLQDDAYRCLAAELDSLLDPDPVDPWPRHYQHFGANFAVTAGTYQRVGGLPVTPVLEDMAFFDHLRRCDVPIRHSPLARVTTSARRGGRVAMGLSTQLGEWDEMARAGRQPIVESAVEIEREARLRRVLRTLWQTGQAGQRLDDDLLRLIARLPRLDPRWLAAEVTRRGPFGLCHERVRAAARTRELPSVARSHYTTLPVATRAVQQRITELREVPSVRSIVPAFASRTFFEEVEAVG